MMNFFRTSLLFLCLAPWVTKAQPTFADLSVWGAKGYFKNGVSANATLEQCTAFLNNQGVCFSLFDLMDSKAMVTQEDFARVVGQAPLLFLGEAAVEKGCIKKPEEIETWVDYCLLNDVNLPTLWRGFLQRMEKGSFPEVQRFFGKSPIEGDKK
jgi:hypothetical protein